MVTKTHPHERYINLFAYPSKNLENCEHIGLNFYRRNINFDSILCVGNGKKSLNDIVIFF